jgi:prepilin-type N-terminal cleavage/methylation domain-containing protein
MSMPVKLRWRSQRGMTLVETLLSMTVMSVVILAFGTVMASVQTGVERQIGRSSSNDQARQAVEELDKEIRSGNLLYDPSLETGPPGSDIDPGMALRVYTQTNADTRTPGNRCVQWRITSADSLQRRYWSINWRTDDVISPWIIVADSVVNRTLSPPEPAFVLDPDPAKGGRSMKILIAVNADPSAGQTVRIQQTLTGRNTQYGYPSQICSDIPPY